MCCLFNIIKKHFQHVIKFIFTCSFNFSSFRKMPLSNDVWRMRVGKFKVPPSKLSRKLDQLQDEWQSDVSAPPSSVMICCPVALVTGRHLVVNQPCTQDMLYANYGFELDDSHSYISYLRLDLLFTGDVES